MKPPEREDVIKIKIRRAKKSLLEAKILYENSFYNAAISRLYYACYYAATALLYKIEIYTKTHAGVKQMLGQHYIKNGLLPEKLGEFYSDILYSRHRADYDELEENDREIVSEYFLSANQFVDTVQKLLEL